MLTPDAEMRRGFIRIHPLVRKEHIMKTLVRLTSLALVALPALAFAQSTPGPVTRAEVRADLIRVEKAGYNPFGNDANYPVDIQAAEAKVAAQQGTPAIQSETRALVRQDLLKWETAGYDPFRVGSTYPAELEAAEARVSGTTTASPTPVQKPVATMAAVPAIPRIDRPRNAFYDGA